MTQSDTRRSWGFDERVSRRALLRSTGAVAVGGVASRAGMETGTAQLASLWSAQRYNPANEGYAPTMEPLRAVPEVSGQANIAAGVASSGFLVDGNTAYVHGVNGGLAAVNTDSNEAAWRLDIGSETITPEFLTGGRLVGRSTGGTVYSIDAETGEIDAESSFGFGRGLGWNGEDVWIGTTYTGGVTAGRIGSGDSIWETDVSGVGFRPAVDQNTQQAFVTTADEAPEDVNLRNPAEIDGSGTLYALDLREGTVQWERSRPAAGACDPVVSDSTVFWAGADGAVRAYDAASGELQWEHTTDDEFYRTPAVADQTVFVGTERGELLGVDTSTGEEIGRVSVADTVTSTPVVAGSVVYFGTAGQTAHAFDYESGEQLWEFETRDPVNSMTPFGGGVIVDTDVGYTVLTAGGTEQGATTNVDRRGLFSNGAGASGPASDPVNLTTLGFLLSVVGIGYQMLQGR